MKTALIRVVLFAYVIMIVACSGNDNKSDAYGNFEATEIIISSELHGSLVSFEVESGQELMAEMEVGLIDTASYDLSKQLLFAQKSAISTKIANIQAQIDVRNEQKRTLEKEKERIINLLEDGAATSKQLDDITGQLNIIDKQIESIKTQNLAVIKELEVIDKQIEQVNDQIRKCFIINPVNGTILDKYAEPFEIVTPGKALYKIANLVDMFLVVYVSGDQLPGIKLGQKVQVLIDEDVKENREMEGEVIWISSQAEFTPKIIQTKEERVTLVYAVKIKVINDGYLKIGMPGEVNFEF